MAQELGKTVEEIYELPASEIEGWKEYFSIYPFTQDREDTRIALLATIISNVSGKSLKKITKLDDFMPQYLLDKTEATEKSLMQQKQDWENFKARARAIEKESGVQIFRKEG